VGTISIENSELLARRLRREKIKHTVLNAKYHEMEAEIVAQAGRKGAVTIATNMAGRGTDILLGGNPDFLTREELKKKGFSVDTAPPVVLEQVTKEMHELVKREHDEVINAGGLHILGTERHEARRIDNQLRGRSGRQGDPGSSRFYISLEDDLMKILGTDRIRGLLVRAGMTDGVPIENRLVSRAIENAQKQIESQNFSIRKHLLEYDDVMNKQRQLIYSIRKDNLMGKDFKEHIRTLSNDIFEDIFNYYVNEDKEPDQWDFESLQKEILAQFGVDINDLAKEGFQDMAWIEIKDTISNHMSSIYQEKEDLIGSAQMRELERMIMLQIIDSQWKDHLLNIDHLKEGIGLRGYAQKDPLVEYKRESYRLFESMQDRIDEEVIRFLYLFHPVEEDEMESWKRKKKSKAIKPSHRLPKKRSKKKKKRRK
jgi:preprotein translocase subunit SecA